MSSVVSFFFKWAWYRPLIGLMCLLNYSSYITLIYSTDINHIQCVILLWYSYAYFPYMYTACYILPLILLSQCLFYTVFISHRIKIKICRFNFWEVCLYHSQIKRNSRFVDTSKFTGQSNCKLHKFTNNNS